MSDTENPKSSAPEAPVASATEGPPQGLRVLDGGGAKAKGRGKGGGRGGGGGGRPPKPPEPFTGFTPPPRGPFEEKAAKGGRTSDVCPGLILEFVELIGRRGNSISRTCRLLGVDREIYKDWVRRGANEVAEGREETLHAQFYLQVPRARDDLFQSLTWGMMRLAAGDPTATGNFFQMRDMLGLLFPEMVFEVRQQLADMHAQALQRLKAALPPDMWELALKAIAEAD